MPRVESDSAGRVMMCGVNYWFTRREQFEPHKLKALGLIKGKNALPRYGIPFAGHAVTVIGVTVACPGALLASSDGFFIAAIPSGPWAPYAWANG